MMTMVLQCDDPGFRSCLVIDDGETVLRGDYASPGYF